MDYSPANRLFYMSALSDEQINCLYGLASEAYSDDFTEESVLEDTFGRMNKLSLDFKHFLVLSLENIFNQVIFDKNVSNLNDIDSVKKSKDLVAKKVLTDTKNRKSLNRYYNQNSRQFTGLGIVQVLKFLYDVDHYEHPDDLVVNPFFEECRKYLNGGFGDFADRVIEKDKGSGKTRKSKNRGKETPLGAKFRNMYDVFFDGSLEYEDKDLPLDELLSKAKEEVDKILPQEDARGAYSFEDFEADLANIPDENIADFVKEHKYLIGTIYREAMTNDVQKRLGSGEFPKEYKIITKLENNVDARWVVTVST